MRRLPGTTTVSVGGLSSVRPPGVSSPTTQEFGWPNRVAPKEARWNGAASARWNSSLGEVEKVTEDQRQPGSADALCDQPRRDRVGLQHGAVQAGGEPCRSSVTVVPDRSEHRRPVRAFTEYGAQSQQNAQYLGVGRRLRRRQYEDGARCPGADERKHVRVTCGTAAADDQGAGGRGTRAVSSLSISTLSRSASSTMARGRCGARAATNSLTTVVT